MPISFEQADEIYRAPKELVPPLRWRSTTSSNNSFQRRNLESALLLSGGSPRGVYFRIIVYAGSLVRATFQLECDLPGSRTHVPLYRLDLGPYGGHLNKDYGPEEIRGLYIPPGQTHEHLFYDSLRQDRRLREDGCPQARILDNPPTDFPTALSLVCSKINIVNGHEVPNPGDQGLLL